MPVKDKLPILVVLHQGRSNPGRVGRWLSQAGYPLDVLRPFWGQDLPATMEGHAGAVVFGGPMSANDETDAIRRELRWLDGALAEDKPLLGICLGAQLIARALGARVAPHPEGRVEIGYYPLTAVPDVEHAASSPLVGLPAFPEHVFHWHGEGFDIARGARLIAGGGGDFENQAFAYGRAIGVQFHPEMTYQMVWRWLTLSGHRLAEPGARSREEVLSAHLLHGAGVADWLEVFLPAWIEPIRQSRQPVARRDVSPAVDQQRMQRP